MPLLLVGQAIAVIAHNEGRESLHTYPLGLKKLYTPGRKERQVISGTVMHTALASRNGNHK